MAMRASTAMKKKRSRRSLHKGVTNLQKKLDELSGLCGIDAFLIYNYSPSDQLQSWPADPNTLPVLLDKFGSTLARVDRTEKARLAAAGEEKGVEEEMVAMEDSDEGSCSVDDDDRKIQGMEHEELMVTLHKLNRLHNAFEEEVYGRSEGNYVEQDQEQEEEGRQEGREGWLDLTLSPPAMDYYYGGDVGDLVNTSLRLA